MYSPKCILVVYLTLGPTTITTDNTEVGIIDIAITTKKKANETSSYLLTCHTDDTTCCRGSDIGSTGTKGKWTYPNGTKVPGFSAKNNFFAVRTAPRQISLARTEGVMLPPLSPNGSFCCTVPTTGGVMMTLCANLGE